MSSSLRVAGTASLGCIGSWQPGHMTRGKGSAASVLISRPISQGGGVNTRFTAVFQHVKNVIFSQRMCSQNNSRIISYHDLAKVSITAEPPNYSAGSGPQKSGYPTGGQPAVRRQKPIDEDRRLRLSRKGPRGSYRLRRASATSNSPRPQATFAATRRQKLS